MKRLILYIAGLIFLAGCSTTKHLPEGEILYTGQKPMIVLNRSETSVGEIAMEEVEATEQFVAGKLYYPLSLSFRTVDLQWFPEV